MLDNSNCHGNGYRDDNEDDGRNWIETKRMRLDAGNGKAAVTQWEVARNRRPAKAVALVLLAVVVAPLAAEAAEAKCTVGPIIASSY